MKFIAPTLCVCGRVKFVGEGPCVTSQEDITRNLEFCDGRRNNCVNQSVATGKISMWKHEEIAQINERKDAGFSKPFVKRTRTDAKLIYD